MIMYIIVFAFIVLDFVTGLVKAFAKKEFTSTVMRQGLFHKCGSILCIVFGWLVDYCQQVVEIGLSIPVAVSICTYMIVMEIGSIIENICAINPQIMPDKLKSYFEKLRC